MQTVFSTTHRAWARSIFPIELHLRAAFLRAGACARSPVPAISRALCLIQLARLIPNASVVLTSEATT